MRLALLLIGVTCLSGCDAPGGHEPSQAVLVGQSAMQRLALADGEVTRDEYREALEQTRICLSDRGYPTTPLRDLPDGIRIDFGVDVGGDTVESMWHAWDQCRIEHSYAIEVVYFASQVRPSSEWPSMRREFTRCLLDAGIVGVRDDMDDGTVASLIAEQGGSVTAWACRERFLILLGLARPVPPAATNAPVQP